VNTLIISGKQSITAIKLVVEGEFEVGYALSFKHK
jgi:hypothetical protein